jgi:ligand-binding sensor protein
VAGFEALSDIRGQRQPRYHAKTSVRCLPDDEEAGLEAVRVCSNHLFVCDAGSR